MPDVETIEITYDFHIEVLPQKKKPYPKEIRQEIEEIWKKECQSHRHTLYNGQLLSAVSLSEDSLQGEFVEYKTYVAQIRYPALYHDLRVKPVCISGYTSANEHLLFGLRSENVTEYRGLYELVPSGGVDPTSLVDGNGEIDLRKQFLTELAEEAMIGEEEVFDFQPRFLIYYAPTFHYEVCAKIEVDPQVLSRSLKPSEEYTEYQWILKENVQDFTSAYSLVPISSLLLDLMD